MIKNLNIIGRENRLANYRLSDFNVTSKPTTRKTNTVVPNNVRTLQAKEAARMERLQNMPYSTVSQTAGRSGYSPTTYILPENSAARQAGIYGYTIPQGQDPEEYAKSLGEKMDMETRLQMYGQYSPANIRQGGSLLKQPFIKHSDTNLGKELTRIDADVKYGNISEEERKKQEDELIKQYGGDYLQFIPEETENKADVIDKLTEFAKIVNPSYFSLFKEAYDYEKQGYRDTGSIIGNLRIFQNAQGDEVRLHENIFAGGDFGMGDKYREYKGIVSGEQSAKEQRAQVANAIRYNEQLQRSQIENEQVMQATGQSQAEQAIGAGNTVDTESAVGNMEYDMNSQISNSALQSLAQEYPEFASLISGTQGVLNAHDSAIKSYAGLAGMQMSDIADSESSLKTIVDDMQTRKNAVLQQVMDTAKNESQRRIEVLESQKRNQQELLNFERLKATRELRREKEETADKMVASLALSGGFGSSAGIKGISDVEARFDIAIADIGTQYQILNSQLVTQVMDISNQIYSNYDNQVFNALQNWESGMSAIDTMAFSASTSLKSQKSNIFKELFSNVNDAKMAKSEAILDLTKTIMSSVADAQKAKLENAVTNMDTFDAVQNMHKLVTGNDVISSSGDALEKVEIMETALNEWDNMNLEYQRGERKSPPSAVFIDQALITVYNKMLDKNSVVREAEYARTSDDLALINRIRTATAKVFFGGAIDDATRRDAVRIAKSFGNVYRERLDDAVAPYLAQISRYNNDENVQNKIMLEEVFPADVIPFISEATYDDIASIMMTGDTSEVTDIYEVTDIPSIETPSGYNVGQSIMTTVIPESSIITAMGTEANPYGIDLFVEGGSDILSPKSGKVVGIQTGQVRGKGWGNYVQVQFEDGNIGQFAHLGDVNVGIGDTVNAGEKVGTMGNTGHTLGPTGLHLDFTLMDANKNKLPVHTASRYITKQDYIAYSPNDYDLEHDLVIDDKTTIVASTNEHIFGQEVSFSEGDKLLKEYGIPTSTEIEARQEEKRVAKELKEKELKIKTLKELNNDDIKYYLMGYYYADDEMAKAKNKQLGYIKHLAEQQIPTREQFKLKYKEGNKGIIDMFLSASQSSEDYSKALESKMKELLQQAKSNNLTTE